LGSSAPLAVLRTDQKLKSGALGWQRLAERINRPEAPARVIAEVAGGDYIQYSLRNQLVFGVEDQPLLEAEPLAAGARLSAVYDELTPSYSLCSNCLKAGK
jgi:hypothetical protein